MIDFRENVRRMQGYVPGEQPAPGAKVIKLNTNENPYPPSPKVMQALQSFDAEWLRLYPQPDARMVREAAAKAFGVPADWVMVCNGSDETLALLVRTLLEPGRKVAYPAPTYSLYSDLAEMQDATIVEVPYLEGYRLPVDGLLEVQAHLTFVCSPNNPTATVAALDDLDRLAAGSRGVLAIDEAYVDFADQTALGLVEKYENVMVLRTLSKAYSLAGLRLGLGVAQPPLLAGLTKVKDSYNVDAVAQHLAAAALADQEWVAANAQKVKTSRAGLLGSLSALGFESWPTQANFIWTRPAGGDAGRVYRELKEKGILVRYWDKPGLADKVRITVGTDEQNQALVEALGEIIP